LPKVKVFLDAGCSKQILLDDGRCIIEIKDRCAFSGVPRDFKEKRKRIARETKKQIFLSSELFGSVKEGCELKI
jgi:hypothetical protein